MPRQPNTQPTTIYWLLDCRPDVIAKGWSNGLPFYCGKTIFNAERRLTEHGYQAMRHPSRRLSQRLLVVGEHVRTHVVEVVPLSGDWVARERHWITILRFSFPGVANTNDGGAGAPGNIHSSAARAAMSAGNRGKKQSKRTRERIAAAVRRVARERREKLAAAGLLTPLQSKKHQAYLRYRYRINKLDRRRKRQLFPRAPG